MDELTIRVMVAPTGCYNCGAETCIVSAIEICSDSTYVGCLVSDFTGYLTLLAAIQHSLAGKVQAVALKAHHSRTLQRG